MRLTRFNILFSYALAVIGVAVLTGVMFVFGNHVNPTTVALVFLLFILFLATAAGSKPALVASALAMFCFNYFFPPPIGTLTISNPQNWIALVAFLVVAITAGQLSAKAKQRAVEAEKLYFELQEAFEDVEVGLNVTGNINLGRDSTTLVPAVKWRVYNGEKNGVQVVVGDNLFIPVRNKSYNIGNYAYAQVSKTFKSKTRITGGGYYFTKNVVSTAARGGGQFGFEQPITDKFGIAADYYTGKNAAGYFTPGINFKPHPKVTGYIGYSIGNDNPRSNNFFYAAIGINLN